MDDDDDMILYVRDPKDSARKLLEPIKSSAKYQDARLTCKNQQLSYKPMTNIQERNKEIIAFVIVSKI